MTQEELNKIINLHKKWLNEEKNGIKADLREADLSNLSLYNADLTSMNLIGTNFTNIKLANVNLTNADLKKANFTNAELYKVNLSCTDLSNSNLTGASLSFVDLSDASLTKANLTNIYLYKTIGNKKHIKNIFVDKYDITYTATTLQIGCKLHTIEEWKNFTNREVSKMDKYALSWWNKWKGIIFEIIEMSPVKKD